MLPWRLSFWGILSKPWSAIIADDVQDSPENVFTVVSFCHLCIQRLHLSMKSPQVHDHKKVKLTSSVPYWNLPPLWKVGCTLTWSIPGLQSISFSADPHSNYKCQRPAPNMVPIFVALSTLSLWVWPLFFCMHFLVPVCDWFVYSLSFPHVL